MAIFYFRGLTPLFFKDNAATMMLAEAEMMATIMLVSIFSLYG
jgi:hypothetical protein